MEYEEQITSEEEIEEVIENEEVEITDDDIKIEIIDEIAEEDEVEEPAEEEADKKTAAIIKAKREAKQYKEELEQIRKEREEMQSLIAEQNKMKAEAKEKAEKEKLIRSFIDKGYDDEIAKELTEGKISQSRQQAEISELKNMMKELLTKQKTEYETKMQVEQEMLNNKQNVKKKSVVSATTVTKPTIRMTSEQKRQYDIVKQSNPNISKKRFLELY